MPPHARQPGRVDGERAGVGAALQAVVGGMEVSPGRFRNQEEPGPQGTRGPARLSTVFGETSLKGASGRGRGGPPVGRRGDSGQPCARPARGVPGPRRRSDTPQAGARPRGGAERPWRAARTRATGRSGGDRGPEAPRGQGQPLTPGPGKGGGCARRGPGTGGCPRPPPAPGPLPAYLARRRRWSAPRWPCRPRTSAASPGPRWPWRRRD